MRLLGVVAGLAIAGGFEPASAAEPRLVMFQSAPGRFEVAAIDPNAAQRVVAEATVAWFHLTRPLGLPDAFSSSVLVRLVPAMDWSGIAPFNVVVETGGLVSVRIRWDEAVPDDFVRRALVQALLMRLAVHHHGVSARLAAPLWLEHACVGWWRTHAEPAQLDAVKQADAKSRPPTLMTLLDWQRGEVEAADLVNAALWLLALLQSENGRGFEWSMLLKRLLAGDSAASVLGETLAGRFASDAERELWWQTGWHQLRRARVLPALEAAESRAELAALMRFVFLQHETERVVPLVEVLAHAREPEVESDLKQRAAALARLLPALHPFYRNPGLSLSEALVLREAVAERRAAVVSALERDWLDAQELEAETSAALDAVERKLGTARRQ